jgi:hypothetical protein
MKMMDEDERDELQSTALLSGSARRLVVPQLFHAIRQSLVADRTSDVACVARGTSTRPTDNP